MTEAEHTLYGARFTMLDHPTEILRLQIGDTHMTNHTFLAQLHEGRQCLIDHLLQTTFQISLELHVMYVDDIDIVDMQTLKTLIHTLLGTLGGIVPHIDAILTVAAHLRREVILITRQILQSLAQYRLCLIMSVIRRHINEVDTVLNGCKDSLDTFCLTNIVEDSSQRRGAKTKITQSESGFSQFVIYHILSVYILYHSSLFTEAQ